MHTFFRVLFQFVGAGILSLPGCSHASDSANTGGAKPSGATTDQQRDSGKKGQPPEGIQRAISAEELTEEFAKTNEAAHKKYSENRKVMEIEGTVENVRKQIPSVNLAGVKKMSINCTFYPNDSPEADKVKGLKHGQKVKIKGKYSIYFPDSHLISFEGDSVEIVDEAKSK